MVNGEFFRFLLLVVGAIVGVWAIIWITPEEYKLLVYRIIVAIGVLLIILGSIWNFFM